MRARTFEGTKSTNTERNAEIDMFRGLGILLVTLGHTTGLPGGVHRYVYSFHMPAFFFLPGYLFQLDKVRRSPGTFVNGKFHRLIIPAWCMGAVCGLVFVAKLLLHRVTLAAFLGLAWGTASASRAPTAISFPHRCGFYCACSVSRRRQRASRV